MDYSFIKATFGVIVTLGLYSVLYKETKVYRFFEHLFLGLAAGYTLVATYRDILYPLWVTKMMGVVPAGSTVEVRGYWIYAALLPIGLMGYFVFDKKNNWISRIPIGIILGLWSGQQIQVWWNTYGPQIYGSMQPVIPTTWTSLVKPALFTRGPDFDQKIALARPLAAKINSEIYPSEALSNFIFVLCLVASFTYFVFSFELKGRVLKGFNTLGRWFLMVGFGAIFGSTVMARFALVIDRLSFIWNEWLHVGGR